MTESVVFHPMDQIYNSISSWIITTAIDFNPYKDALFGINQYALKVKQSLTSYSESFNSSDPRYSLLLNMTKPKDIRTKRSLLSFGGLFNFLLGTANDDDVRSMKQDIQKLHDNQIS